MLDIVKYREIISNMPKEELVEECAVLAAFSEMYRDIIINRCVMTEKELQNKEFGICGKIASEMAPWLLINNTNKKEELN